MLIKSTTGVATLADIQVQKSISHILLLKKGTANTVVAERITATLKLQSGGEQVVLPNIKIDDVAVLSQYENGYIYEQLAGGLVTYSALLEITLGDMLQLSNDSYLSIDLSGLEVGATYEVYGIETLKDDRRFLKYTSREIVGATPQQIQLPLGENSQVFAIRNNGALAKVRLTAYNGKQVTYLPEELKTLAREMNGMTKGPDVLVEGDSINQAYSGGATGFFILPSVAFSQIEIETVGGTALEYISVNVFKY